MKKLILMALAIAAMAACTKSNVEFDQPGEIAFQPVTEMATKATFAGTAYPQDSTFNVWAWWGDVLKTDSPDYSRFNSSNCYINEQKFTRRDYVSWGGETPYYWPTTGSLVFAGYSPAVDGNKKNTFNYYLAANGEVPACTFTATNYKQSTNIKETTDLMWFDVTSSSYDKTTAAPGVNVTFKHALSWLTFRFTLLNAWTPQNWKIKSVKLTNIFTVADFTAVKNGNTAWSGWEVPLEFVVCSNSDHQVGYVQNEYNANADDSSVLEDERNGVVVIPQSVTNKKLVIEFEQLTPAGDWLKQDIMLDLKADGDAWQTGKHYIYTITFDAAEILIAPTVTDWISESQNVAIPVQ